MPASWGGDRTVITLAASYAPAATVVSPGTAVAQFQLQSDGDIAMTVTNNGVVDVGDWLAPVGNQANYEAFATLISGTLTSGTTGSWLDLASTQAWTKSKSGVGAGVTCTITVDIRRKGTGVNLASTTVTLTATVESGG